jgi:hypothetical protein
MVALTLAGARGPGSLAGMARPARLARGDRERQAGRTLPDGQVVVAPPVFPGQPFIGVQGGVGHWRAERGVAGHMGRVWRLSRAWGLSRSRAWCRDLTRGLVRG